MSLKEFVAALNNSRKQCNQLYYSYSNKHKPLQQSLPLKIRAI